MIQVRAKGFGSQPRAFHPPADGPIVVWLRPVAKVSGRLVGAQSGVVRGWKVSALTTPSDGVTARDGYWVGEAETTSDERGRLRHPGHRRREPDPHLPTAGGRPLPGREPVRGAPRRGGQPGQGRRPARGPARGPVPRPPDRRGDPGRPAVRRLPDRDGPAGASSRTNRAGSRSSSCPGMSPFPPRRCRSRMSAPPPPDGVSVKVPEGVDRFSVDPIEVVHAAPPIRGVVLNESGRPIAGAAVQGEWEMTEATRGGVYAAAATTDADGRFALEDIAPDVAVKVSARSREAATAEPVAARAGQPEAMTLRLVRSATSAIGGRVLGPGGRPFPGARIRVHYQRQTSASSRSGGFVAFEGVKEIRTADDGTFRTPRELLRADEYRVEALADGFIAGMTDWVRLAPGDGTSDARHRPDEGDPAARGRGTGRRSSRGPDRGCGRPPVG